MAIYQGAIYTKVFQLPGVGDITGWEFKSQFRTRLDGEVLLELTTGNGGWTVIDGPNAYIKMSILADQSEDLPVGKIIFDVERTDIDPGPVWLFSGKVPVKQPVTRDE